MTAAIVAGSVLWLSRPAGGRGLVQTIVHDTLGHQESPEAYGASPFGFWGSREGLRGWLMQPVVPAVPMTCPAVLAFLAFSAAGFLMARRRRPSELALIAGVTAIAVQLWKVHGTGTYVTWYYPFLLLGFFASSRDPVGRERHNGSGHEDRRESVAPFTQQSPPSQRSALVIGAGPAGLTGAHLLLEHGVAVTVLERDSQVGGIARTVDYKGYRFDIGGHRFFTR